MTAHGDAIAAAGDASRRALQAKHEAREITLAASRPAIRSCALAIRAVHRGDFDDARAHIIEAHGIKGDMKRGHTLITIKPVDAKHSLIEVDILLVPVLPAPQSYVDEELRDGAQDFVNGLRDKAQGTVGPVVSL